MKTGVVPIGSNVGGIKEVIKHDETGFIVDIGDSTKVSMRYNCFQKELYNKMQTAMLKDIDERFGSVLITDQYEHYYRKNVKSKRD